MGGNKRQGRARNQTDGPINAPWFDKNKARQRKRKNMAKASKRKNRGKK